MRKRGQTFEPFARQHAYILVNEKLIDRMLKRLPERKRYELLDIAAGTVCRSRKTIAGTMSPPVIVATLWVPAAALAVSYDVTVVNIPLNAETAELVVWADCLPRNVVTVHENLRRVLDELSEEGPTAAELDVERNAANRWWATSDEVRALMEDYGHRRAHGLPDLVARRLPS